MIIQISLMGSNKAHQWVVKSDFDLSGRTILLIWIVTIWLIDTVDLVFGHTIDEETKKSQQQFDLREHFHALCSYLNWLLSIFRAPNLNLEPAIRIGMLLILVINIIQLFFRNALIIGII